MDSADILIFLYVCVAAMVKMEGGSALGLRCEWVEGEKINAK